MKRILRCRAWLIFSIVFAVVTEASEIQLPIKADENVVLLSGFGKRKIRGRWRFHAGIDIATYIGQYVYAVGDGEVKEVDFSCPNHRRGMRYKNPAWACGERYGNRIVVKLETGDEVLFAHLTAECSFVVEPGQKVRAGEIIGCVGNSGSTFGPHLHFEVRDRKNLLPANPLLYLGALANQYKIGKIRLKKEIEQIVAKIEINRRQQNENSLVVAPADFYQDSE